MNTNESIYKTETDIVNKALVAEEEREQRRDKLEIWD